MKADRYWLFSIVGMTSIMLMGLGGFSDDSDYDDDVSDDEIDNGIFGFVVEALLETKKAACEAGKWDFYYGDDPGENKRHNRDNAIRYSSVRKLADEDLRRIRNKAFFLKHKRVTIGYCSEDLLGLNVNSVTTMLHNKAFTRISMIPVKRMRLGSSDKPGTVKRIMIGRNSVFQETDTFPYDTHIKIYYCNGKINLPLSSEQLKKMDYQKACDYLEELGFVNIKIQPKNDLVLGLLHSQGEIDRISIDGDCYFRKTRHFRLILL